MDKTDGKAMDFLHKIKAATLRELRLMRQRPVYLIASVGVMAFCCIFFLTLLRDGFPKDLATGIVDLDKLVHVTEFHKADGCDGTRQDTVERCVIRKPGRPCRPAG